MSENLPAYRRAFNYMRDAKVTVSMTLGLLATDLILGDSIAVHSDDSFGRQMEMAIPSAFATPDVTGNDAFDFALVTGNTAISLEAARRTTSYKVLGATAIGAQLASSSADALVDQTNWVSNSTADVGSSAIGVAWATMFLLDRTASAENETNHKRWKGATALFMGSMTLGALIVMGGDDGKLDMLSHGSAIAIGAIAYRFGAWRKQYKTVYSKT
jgi:hypothetical protein